MHRWLSCALVCAGVVACGDEPAADDGGGTGGTGGSGGSGGGAGGAGPLSLSFVDDVNFDTGTLLDGVEMGGLSGITIDPSDGHAWAICDDQEQFGPVRFYELAVTVDDGGIGVTPLSFTPFQTGSTPSMEMDAEGIARTATGELYVSAEGDTTPVVAPAIIVIDGAGQLLEELVVDAKHIPDAGQTKGVRRNQGFEALTLSPDGQSLFTATERALVQDGPPPSFEQGNRCRILRYDVASGAPAGEYFYLTDPIPPASAGVLGAADIGVAEMLALSSDRLLVLERAAVQVDGAFTNTIRLYEVSLDNAPDIAALDPMPADAVPLDKRLVLDLDTILGELDPSYPTLDNFEAMSFGPPLADGRQSLVLVSDNNFGATQRTAFFAFAID